MHALMQPKCTRAQLHVALLVTQQSKLCLECLLLPVGMQSSVWWHTTSIVSTSFLMGRSQSGKV